MAVKSSGAKKAPMKDDKKKGGEMKFPPLREDFTGKVFIIKVKDLGFSYLFDLVTENKEAFGINLYKSVWGAKIADLCELAEAKEAFEGDVTIVKGGYKLEIYFEEEVEEEEEEGNYSAALPF